ncbi:MAG: hypothetical protein WCR36_07020 [Bacteroidaceae bacterium]
MKKSIIISLLAGLVGMMSFTSCLDTESNRFVDAKSELTEQDSVFRMLGILNGIKKISARYVLLGELRGDLMNTTNYASDDLRELNSLDISSTNSYVTQKEYYSIINQCNYIIVKGAALPKEQAVARIIRAWTYMQLALNYGKCQYYENIIDSKSSADASYPEYDIKQLASILIPQLEKVYADFNLDLRWPSYGSATGRDLRTQMLDYRFVLADLYMWSAEPGDTDAYLRAASLYEELIKLNSSGISAGVLSASYYGSSEDVYGNSYNEGQKTIKYITNSSKKASGRPYYTQTATTEVMTSIYVPVADSTNITSNIDSLTGIAPNYELKSISLGATPRARALWAGTKYAFVAGTSGDCDESDYCVKPFTTYLKPLTPTYDFMGDTRIIRNYTTVNRPTSGGYVTDSLIYTYRGYSGDTKTVYLTRRTQLYLRWATAMTAAGKPNLAMVALKYGLNDYNIMLYTPDYEKKSKAVDQYGLSWYRMLIWDNSTNAKTGQSFLRNTGTPTTKAYLKIWPDTVRKYNYKLPIRTIVNDDQTTSLEINAASDTIYYLFNDTIEPSYDFSSAIYGANAGVHSRGAGCAAADTTYKMPYEMYPVAATATAAEREPLVQKQMAYMYDMICREYALESPFEGGRFHDLMMFSRLTGSPTFLANWMSYKDASFATKLAVPGDHTWDSKSWYLPKSSKEK